MGWTSTEVPGCTDHAACDDGLECTINTCNAGVCETAPVPGCMKQIRCGNSKSSNCQLPQLRDAELTELHEVRCCSDTDQGWGYARKAACTTTGSLGRDVWAVSAVNGVCNSVKTYADAADICSGSLTKR